MSTPGPRKRIHLAAHFPGVNSTTVWADPRSGSQIDFSSFAHLARTAERGLFDFFFLAEGLRLREHAGRIHDLDVVGRPESITVLNALAAVTDRLGLAATVNATFNEPYELARRLASLDHLSAGRAAWNVVTSSDAFTGENFRRGGYLDRADRYTRAAEFLATARELWDSWTPEGTPKPFAHSGPQFRIDGEFTVPRSPQGHPVVIQAGDSPEGCEFAPPAPTWFLPAGGPGVIPGKHSTRHSTPEAGREFYADVKGRLARHGRRPGDLKIMPGVTYVLGDTDADAREKADEIRRQQVSPQNAILALEQVWGRDLSGYDPDGPLPDVDPDPDSALVQGRVRVADPVGVARKWRALSEARGSRSGRPSSRPPAGSPSSAARRRSRRPWRSSSPRTPPTASSSSRTSLPAASTTSSTGSCPCSRSAGLPHGVHRHDAPVPPRAPRARTKGLREA